MKTFAAIRFLLSGFFAGALSISNNYAYDGCLPVPQPNIDTIRSYFNGHIEEGRLGGAIVLIFGPDNSRYLETFGFADVEKEIALKPDALIPIASMAKVMTSVAMLQLAQKKCCRWMIRLTVTSPRSGMSVF